MSVIYFILALFACIASGVGGAFGMRFYIERDREIAEQEDPRDTKIRDLQTKIKLAGDESARDRAMATSATEHVELAHQRINELLDELRAVRHDLQNLETLRSDNDDEKELLRDKLSVAGKQLDTLKLRNQELEVALSVTREPEMLTIQDTCEGTDETEEDIDLFKPAVTDGSPSLIQALTDELDRWKRHCHVLGDELKHQRERSSETDTVAVDSTAAMPEIDELTDIRGIGPALARKLHMLGIYRYEDLLNIDQDLLKRAKPLIPDFERRMKRDNWHEQARVLSGNKHPQTAEQATTSAPS